MKVVYRDEGLALIWTEQAAQLRLPDAVIKSARRKLHAMGAATDERDLRNVKSLHFEKLKGDREGQYSIRVNDQWRIVFILNNTTAPTTIEVLAIEDYH